MTTRRSFIRTLGRGTVAIAVLGPLACSTSDTGSSPTAGTTPTTSQPPPRTSPTTSQAPVTTEPVSTTAPGTRWERVNLGFVSAYIIARSDRAVLVDTGVAGSEGAIEASLGEAGLGWTNVDHVIITHLHGDHQGSLPAVMDAAPQAMGYGGEEDLSGITSPRPMTAVGDGDEVFGLQIIETPGHTAGSISVLDPEGSVLVAGDALNYSGGQVSGSNPQFTADAVMADESVRKLARFTFDVLLTGHSEPVLTDADDLVGAFAASI